MYYRITDEDEERLRENCTNIVRRHCRIGNVTMKYLPSHLRLNDLPMAPAWDVPFIWNPNTSAAEHLIPLPHGVCL